MATYLADGIGGSLGDSLAMSSGMIAICTTWYVSSVSGADATTNGRDRARPFATLAYAISQAVAQDIIVLLSDHTETMNSVVVNKELLVIGEGSSEGKPTVSVWGNATGTSEVLTITADRVEVRNVRFRPQTIAATAPFINWSGTDGLMKGCYLESDQYDDGPKLKIGDRLTVDSSTFISVATSIANRPEQAMTTAIGVLALFRMRNCVISGGPYGWASTNTAAYFQATTLQVRIEGLSLLLGSDVKLTSSITGFINVPVATGGSQVRWPG